MKKSIQESIETASSRQTQTVARHFAKELLGGSSKRRGAFLVAIAGELGSGKTTFTQGFARGLGVQEKVLSPTFVIIKSYDVPHAPHGIRTLWHVDCYRLETPEELKELGWDSIVSDPHNIVLVEWPERMQAFLPKDTISISLETTGHTTRTIALKKQDLS